MSKQEEDLKHKTKSLSAIGRTRRRLGSTSPYLRFDIYQSHHQLQMH